MVIVLYLQLNWEARVWSIRLCPPSQQHGHVYTTWLTLPSLPSIWTRSLKLYLGLTKHNCCVHIMCCIQTMPPFYVLTLWSDSHNMQRQCLEFATIYSATNYPSQIIKHLVGIQPICCTVFYCSNSMGKIFWNIYTWLGAPTHPVFKQWQYKFLWLQLNRAEPPVISSVIFVCMFIMPWMKNINYN